VARIITAFCQEKRKDLLMNPILPIVLVGNEVLTCQAFCCNRVVSEKHSSFEVLLLFFSSSEIHPQRV
jgi:hypothetical protein